MPSPNRFDTMNKNPDLAWAQFSAARTQGQTGITGSYFQRLSTDRDGVVFGYAAAPTGTPRYEVRVNSDGTTMRVRLEDDHMITTDPDIIRSVLGAVATINGDKPLRHRAPLDTLRDVDAYESYADDGTDLGSAPDSFRSPDYALQEALTTPEPGAIDTEAISKYLDLGMNAGTDPVQLLIAD